MEKDTTYVALDDSKRKIVAGILRPSDTQPELREIANDARQIRRLFERLKREGPVAACYEAGVSGYDLHRQITGLVESGPAGTHRPTTRRGSGIAQPSVPRARCPECLARRGCGPARAIVTPDAPPAIAARGSA